MFPCWVAVGIALSLCVESWGRGSSPSPSPAFLFLLHLGPSLHIYHAWRAFKSVHPASVLPASWGCPCLRCWSPKHRLKRSQGSSVTVLSFFSGSPCQSCSSGLLQLQMSLSIRLVFPYQFTWPWLHQLFALSVLFQWFAATSDVTHY